MKLPKFPPQALQVLRIIRAEVPRPSGVPTWERLGDGNWALRWMRGYPRSVVGCVGYCPMGLHPDSANHAPMYHWNFAGMRCGERGVRYFGAWFDSIARDQAQAAVDFIWGPE